MSKILCGITVDDNIYKKWSEKKYEVPGDDVPSRSLRIIEIFSKSKDYETHLPALAEEFKKVVNQAAKELLELQMEKAGKTTFTAGKHDNFSDYIMDLSEVYKTAVSMRLTLKEEHDTAEREWKQVMSDPEAGARELANAKAKFLNADFEYGQKLKELQSNILEDVGKIRSEFEEHLSAFYSANGNRLDDDTLRLLKSGIKLKENEINALLERYTGNTTMIRLVVQYCEDHSIENTQARIYGGIVARNGKDERKSFNDVARLIETVTGRDEHRAATWAKEENFNKCRDIAIQTLDHLFVKPEFILED